MIWQDPKTNWNTTTDTVDDVAMNRIEGNIEFLANLFRISGNATEALTGVVPADGGEVFLGANIGVVPDGYKLVIRRLNSRAFVRDNSHSSFAFKLYGNGVEKIDTTAYPYNTTTNGRGLIFPLFAVTPIFENATGADVVVEASASIVNFHATDDLNYSFITWDWSFELQEI